MVKFYAHSVGNETSTKHVTFFRENCVCQITSHEFAVMYLKKTIQPRFDTHSHMIRARVEGTVCGNWTFQIAQPVCEEQWLCGTKHFRRNYVSLSLYSCAKII